MKKNVFRGSMLIFLALGVLALTGCAKKGDNAKSLGKLVVGFSPGPTSTLTMIAKDLGYYEKTNVEIELVSFSNSADALSALQAGKIDVGISFGTAAPITYATKGAKFMIVAGNLSGGHPVMTRAENAALYKDINSFRGKVVGTPALYTPDVVWRVALYQAGIDWEKDLTIVEFKRPIDILEAVKSGKVDAGIGANTLFAAINELGLAMPLFSNDFMPNHPCCRVVTTENVIKTKRPALVAFIEAQLLSEEKFQQDPEAAVLANMHLQDMTENYARQTSLEPHSQLAVDPNTNGVVEMFNYMQDINYLDRDITLDPHSLIDTSLYLDALKALEKSAPSGYWAELSKRFTEWNS